MVKIKNGVCLVCLLVPPSPGRLCFRPAGPGGKNRLIPEVIKKNKQEPGFNGFLIILTRRSLLFDKF